VSFVKRGGQLSAITVAGDDNCEDLHDAVIAAWQSAPDGVYFDAETHQRAQFHDCTLTFDRYLDVDSWVDRKADAPVSLGMVGMSADKLRTTLGERIDNDDGNSITWYVPGIGRSSLPTEIVANIELAKIVSVHVDVATDQNTADLVRDRLTTLLGTPKVDPDTEVATWTGKTTVTLQAGYGDLTLEISK
jgi:hypothetical protein